MRSVFLVPWRSSGDERDALWTFVRRYYETNLPEIPIFEGASPPGLFNRSAAINDASRLAGPWDVAIVLDADVLIDPAKILLAAKTADETGKLVVAFTIRHDLSKLGTARVLSGFSGSWSRFVERDHRDQHSSAIAIPRALWEKLDGFDEGFVGWGYEDTAFAIAAETVAGPRINLPGECWHLWHRRAPEARAGSPSWSANKRRRDLYAEAARSAPDAISALRKSETPAFADTRIPRILHRVVPERPNETADFYWCGFQQLHPGWELRTWRDPIDPSLFPETSDFWPLVDSGASLSDLVRLEVLLRYGGIFVDWDCRPVRPLDPLLALDTFAGYEDAKVIPNAVLGAKPGAPAIRVALDLAVAAVRGRRGTWEGGPGATTRAFAGRSDVLLLPPESFYPVSYRDPDREAKMRDFDSDAHPATFVLHEYWGSWLEPERRRVPLSIPADPYALLTDVERDRLDASLEAEAATRRRGNARAGGMPA